MGKYVIKEAKTGFKFDLKATNGQVIASSQIYKSLRSCKKGIASVRRNAPIANVEDKTVEPVVTARCPKFEIYLDKGGEYRFRLKATNGQIIAVSEGYTAKPGCLNGIESVRKNAADADIKVKE
jgi:uncharacterized protein YegP (UPF0339 family)